MSDVETTQPANGDALSTGTAAPSPTAMQRADPRHGTRVKVSVHRLDGGLQDGESDARSLTTEGFPIYTPPDSDRARWIPARDIKYVVVGSLDDPNREPDPGVERPPREAVLGLRDGSRIAADRESGR